MKFLIQRVKKATVTIEEQIVGQINQGYLIFVGVCDSDTEETADKLIKKVSSLRIFEDECGKTNLSIKDVDGSILVVSQFTLYADCKKGNRPSFVHAGNPVHAETLYQYVIEQLKTCYALPVQTGSFGADMEVMLINDGPFTIMLDSAEL